MFSDARFHRWRDAQGLMNPARNCNTCQFKDCQFRERWRGTESRTIYAGATATMPPRPGPIAHRRTAPALKWRCQQGVVQSGNQRGVHGLSRSCIRQWCSTVPDEQVVPENCDASRGIQTGNQRGIHGHTGGCVFANGAIAALCDKQVVPRNANANRAV